MGVEMHFETKIRNPDSCVSYLAKNVYGTQNNVISNTNSSSGNKIIHFSNDQVSVFIMKQSKRVSSYRKMDYDVDVNCSFIFRYYSNSQVNSLDNILPFILAIIDYSAKDCLLMPNGNEPIFIRRRTIHYYSDTFEMICGTIAKKELDDRNNISLTPIE